MTDATGLDARVRTARRFGAVGAISLRTRRTWYAEDPPKDDKKPDPAADSGDEVEDVAKLPPWAQRIIRETRDEAKQRRLDLKKMEDQKALDENKRLEDDKKWELLAKKREEELTALKPTAERLTLLEQKMQATNEVRVKRIPEAMRSVIPTDYEPIKLSDWLDKNEGLLTTPSAPTGDGGQRGDGNKPEALTPGELAAAARMGLTPEKMLAAKKK